MTLISIFCEIVINWIIQSKDTLIYIKIQKFSSVQLLSRVRLFATPWIAARQASPSITNSGVHSDSPPSSQWCHPAISSLVVPSSSCPQSLPSSETFPMSQLFAWGGESIGVSASASVLPMNIQDWFPLGLTDLIFLQSKRLSRVFSNTIWKHQFFGSAFFTVQLSHPYMTTGKTIAWNIWTCVGKVILYFLICCLDLS